MRSYTPWAADTAVSDRDGFSIEKKSCERMTRLSITVTLIFHKVLLRLVVNEFSLYLLESHLRSYGFKSIYWQCVGRTVLRAFPNATLAVKNLLRAQLLLCQLPHASAL